MASKEERSGTGVVLLWASSMRSGLCKLRAPGLFRTSVPGRAGEWTVLNPPSLGRPLQSFVMDTVIVFVNLTQT